MWFNGLNIQGYFVTHWIYNVLVLLALIRNVIVKRCRNLDWSKYSIKWSVDQLNRQVWEVSFSILYSQSFNLFRFLTVGLLKQDIWRQHLRLLKIYKIKLTNFKCVFEWTVPLVCQYADTHIFRLSRSALKKWRILNLFSSRTQTHTCTHTQSNWLLIVPLTSEGVLGNRSICLPPPAGPDCNDWPLPLTCQQRRVLGEGGWTQDP